MSIIAVIGAGYVGIPTAANLAHLGHHVVCVDVDAERVRRLSEGDVPILEAGLPALVRSGLDAGRLRFVVGAADAARDAEFVFLCVPTPQSDNGAADLSFVESAVRELAPVLGDAAIVVNKSTMPVGSTDFVAKVLAGSGAPAGVRVASNPEFLRQGHAAEDTQHPSRIVIGSDDREVADRVAALYGASGAPVIVTDPASAELIKYASNAFLATKISFVNSMANLCEAVNADVSDVLLGMGHDPRIGFENLFPGPGYGGSCFPKDTAALLHTADGGGYDFALLRSVIHTNDLQRERTFHKVRAAAGGELRGVPIGVLGLTFKADTDDLRDSPALDIAKRLVEAGAVVRAYDPAAGDVRAFGVEGVERVDDAYGAAHGAAAVALLTEWGELRDLDFARVHESMVAPHAFVDARNLLDPTVMRTHGFQYQGVGR